MRYPRNPGSEYHAAAVVVAHPDDEVLWAGGMVLRHPAWAWRIVTLCRGGDPDRSRRFVRVLRELGAEGAQSDLDDGPAQAPLDPAAVEHALLELAGPGPYDLVLTHGPRGEYTRHRRHEEVCRAVIALWRRAALQIGELWLFAYDDDERRRLPLARTDADRHDELPAEIWQHKHRIMTDLYGFAPDSWEARVTPRAEAFWCFTAATDAAAWIAKEGPHE